MVTGGKQKALGKPIVFRGMKFFFLSIIALVFGQQMEAKSDDSKSSFLLPNLAFVAAAAVVCYNNPNFSPQLIRKQESIDER